MNAHAAPITEWTEGRVDARDASLECQRIPPARIAEEKDNTLREDRRDHDRFPPRPL